MAGEISFVPSADDYVAAQRAHVVASLRSRTVLGRLLGLVLIALLVLVGIALAVDRDWVLALVIGAGGALGGIGALAICLLLNWLLLPRRSRRLFAQQKTLHGEHRFGWDADGFRWSTADASGRIRWADCHRSRSAPRVTLIYLNDLLFHFVPTRALSEAEREELVATIAASEVPK